MAVLAVDIACALGEARKVALGFECPLWIPVAPDPKDLTKARKVDGNRAWSAAAGLGALATGLTQVPWILDEVRRQLTRAGSRGSSRVSGLDGVLKGRFRSVPLGSVRDWGSEGVQVARSERAFG